jgi:dihydrofolate synthase / folylpolyglutamate synthase
MNLDGWLDRLTTLHPQTIELGLDRILRVASKLQVTEFSCPVITIGGTNGKGSCVRFLESIYQAQGYRVGAYTSPHLLKFNERIRINNQLCDDASLIASFERVDSVRNGTLLTFFEFTTLAALCLFQTANLDVLLLEIGLGGRLDAVNIVTSNLAIITSVTIDHTDWLGSTRFEIAKEKAGIFRADKQAVIGEPSPPQSLLTQAQALSTQLYCVGSEFSYRKTAQSWDWYSSLANWTRLPLPKLPIQNAATALMAITLLQNDLPVQRNNIEFGVSSAVIPGRMHKIDVPVRCILDVAHNPASAQLLAEQCKSLPCKGKLIAVVAMLDDKDITNTLLPLRPLISTWHFGSLQIPRGAKAEKLAAVFQGIDNIECYTYDGVSAAFEAAIQSIDNEDHILVYGSFYTVAEILNYLKLDC